MCGVLHHFRENKKTKPVNCFIMTECTVAYTDKYQLRQLTSTLLYNWDGISHQRKPATTCTVRLRPKCLLQHLLHSDASEAANRWENGELRFTWNTEFDSSSVKCTTQTVVLITKAFQRGAVAHHCRAGVHTLDRQISWSLDERPCYTHCDGHGSNR